MIKAIIFDCFGVLTEDSWHVFRTGLPDGPKQTCQDLMQQYSSGFLNRDEFLKGVSLQTGKSLEEISTILSSKHHKNTQLLDYISSLKKQYKISILSNIANNWIRDELLSSNDQSLFDDMLFSFEVGITKPDKRIFELACQRLGVRPDEAVLVDDIESYCLAAKEFGMKAIVYKGFEDMKDQLVGALADSNS